MTNGSLDSFNFTFYRDKFRSNLCRLFLSHSLPVFSHSFVSFSCHSSFRFFLLFNSCVFPSMFQLNSFDIISFMISSSCLFSFSLFKKIILFVSSGVFLHFCHKYCIGHFKSFRLYRNKPKVDQNMHQRQTFKKKKI